MTKMNINTLDEEWDKFLNLASDTEYEQDVIENLDDFGGGEKAPDPTPIYISTKTKIAYLNQQDSRLDDSIPLI
jgi:hypothetical protein